MPITVDVAVQSYRKPELLLLTLLSLRAHSARHVDTVWINDDQSDAWVVDAYRSQEFAQALAPWRIRVRQNTVRTGWWYRPVKGVRHRYMPPRRRLRHWWRSVTDSRYAPVRRHDIRYQWAIDSTDKTFVYVIHDDVFFRADVLGTYLDAIAALQRPSVVGELGQCWRCGWSRMGCTPAAVSSGRLPSTQWPANPDETGDPWPCRMNEWSALVCVDAAQQVEAEHGVLFGNYDNRGDVGAYWFAVAHRMGFEFADPLPTTEQRAAQYVHGDGGSGHSVWVDQGSGKKVYDRVRVIRNLERDFGFAWPAAWGPS